MRTLVLLVCLVLVSAGAAACGTSAPAPAATVTVTASPSAQTAVSTAVVSPSPIPTRTPYRPDARTVVKELRAAGLPIGKVVVYNSSTDPNHLIGRPNGYRSKAAFTDTRINSMDAIGWKLGDIELGGGVEVFKDAARARARKEYIKSLIKSAPILGSEYDYVVGPVLMRVSGSLTGKQAREYRTALREIMRQQ